MAKYLYLWELDRTRIPLDRKERASGWSALMDAVKGDLKRGISKDWGAFVGEHHGYFIAEGDEVEIGLAIQQYVPFVSFTAHPVASVEQVDTLVKRMAK